MGADYIEPDLVLTRGTAPASSRTQAYGRAIDERVTFLRAGVDGLFTDNPDVGVLARELA